METLKLLVVDDEEGMRLAIARALSDHRIRLPDADGETGFDVRLAATGEEALAAIERDPPDILLLDHKLPGISGLDVLERIVPKDPDLVAVMITAYASLETAVRATKRGAFDFIAKPFTPDELRSVVYRAAKQLALSREARRLAREKRQLRFQMLSTVSHELKAPLAAVEQYLGVLVSMGPEGDPEVRAHVVQRSLARIRGMRKLILDLLDLTSIESGRKRREVVPVDLAALARAAVENVLDEARAASVTVALDAPEALVFDADRREVEIVLSNLLSNAVKYNREGGRVQASLRASDEGVAIAVADTGIGMTPEESARLFREFARIRNEKTEKILGSGLGLSIVKRIAGLYGGDVSVESEPDRGSTFTVVLRRTGAP